MRYPLQLTAYELCTQELQIFIYHV